MPLRRGGFHPLQQGGGENGEGVWGKKGIFLRRLTFSLLSTDFDPKKNDRRENYYYVQSWEKISTNISLFFRGGGKALLLIGVVGRGVGGLDDGADVHVSLSAYRRWPISQSSYCGFYRGLIAIYLPAVRNCDSIDQEDWIRHSLFLFIIGKIKNSSFASSASSPPSLCEWVR